MVEYLVVGILNKICFFFIINIIRFFGLGFGKVFRKNGGGGVGVMCV